MQLSPLFCQTFSVQLTMTNVIEVKIIARTKNTHPEFFFSKPEILIKFCIILGFACRAILVILLRLVQTFLKLILTVIIRFEQISIFSIRAIRVPYFLTDFCELF